MELEIVTMTQMILLVCPMIFLASFIDSMAGGGGLISLPVYMMTGLPIHTAFGCNKFSASMGSIISAVRYQKSGKIKWKPATVSAVFSLCGASIGAQINLRLDPLFLKKLVLVILPIAAVVVLFGNHHRQNMRLLEGRRLYLGCGMAGLLIGLYDGVIGPGTGTFMILAYTSFIGYDYVTASGNAKVANLASNLASLIVYLLHGNVLFLLAVPAGICGILGGWIGSSLAISKGTKFIKVIVVLVLIGVFGKLIWDVVSAAGVV